MTYPTLVEIKLEKDKLFEIGENKVNELLKIRTKLETLRKNNGDIDEIIALEDKENQLISEISKIDLMIKILEIVEFIIESGLFEKYLDILEKNIEYDELLDIVVKNNLCVKKTCLEIYKRLGLNDKNILKNIEALEECEEDHEEPTYIKNIIRRINNLKSKICDEGNNEKGRES
ncbi:hypothetical protein J422_01775 [Methanocaldococcus villosus KIN24-T80]|uniref:Uncharacterized protein n=1 Tax=Methanocaldococcus villosus KIN24-T80 TaxID=1069083 RepID=N6V2M3_9EURY|nr:hypothetical protein [Methanocaldococcus villosus]ENN96508.1 hypothetical protein J422_01775 [Methanocaldococcus villosus KIN24-T80]